MSGYSYLHVLLLSFESAARRLQSSTPSLTSVTVSTATRGRMLVMGEMGEMIGIDERIAMMRK